MIEIKITDPHLMNKDAIVKTANFLLAMVDVQLLPAPKDKPASPPPFIPPVVDVSPKDVTPTIAGIPYVPPSPTVNPFAKPIEPMIPPVPTPTAAVQMTPPTPSKPLSLSVDLDRRGLPWDNRIHSRTKSKTNDGLWKPMRGLNPELLKNVEAELFQAMAASPQIVLEPQAPVAVPMPPIADPVAPPQNDFPALMNKITAAVNSQKISSSEVLQIIQEMGLPSLPIVATRPDLIPTIMQKIDFLISLGGK